MWCAAFAWLSLTDDDVDAFRRLKKVRDQVAHGVRDVPTNAEVRDVESLARRLHTRLGDLEAWPSAELPSAFRSASEE